MVEQAQEEEKILELKDIKEIDDIELVISQRAGIGLRDGDVPVGKKFAWFGGTKFELFQPLSITDDPIVIFAMFQDVNEVRIYALLALKKGSAPPKDCAPYQRFTLSKLAAGLVYTEVFPDAKGEPLLGLDTFINAIVSELQKLQAPDAGLEAQDRLDRALEALEADDLDAVMKILKDEEDEDEAPKPNGQVATPLAT
jgi:hypothetical protein